MGRYDNVIVWYGVVGGALNVASSKVDLYNGHACELYC